MALEDGSVTAVLLAAHRDMKTHSDRVSAGEAKSYVTDHGTYFTSLPRDYYISESIFREEMTKVFSRQWLYAGQVSQLQGPGAYYERQIGPESLILCRDQSGTLRAFFNVCRHRGSRICKAGDAGTAKLFVCPYHRWSFRNDGRLMAAPGLKDGQDFDFADWGLHEARVGSFFGSIFVYLADEEPAETLDAYLQARSSDLEKLASVQPERTKLAARKVYEVDANWKTMMENNAECYHCPGAHPKLSRAINVGVSYLTETGEIHPDAKGKMFTFNTNQKTLSGDGEWVCAKPLGDGTGEQSGAGFITFPNFCGVAYFGDYGNAIVVEPLGVDKTRLISEWFVHEDAVEGVDYHVDRLMDAWDTTNLEDVALSNENYKGTTSMRYVPGPNNMRREGMIRYALTTYLDMMNDEPAT